MLSVCSWAILPLVVNDALSEDDFLQVRNLSFRSPVTEVRGLITGIRYLSGQAPEPGSLYVQSGLSLFRFNPQANYKENG